VLLIIISFQTTLFAEMRPFGVAAQLVLLFVVVSGSINGSTIGALTGLIAGLMYDFILPTPVGLTSLALGLAGATAGLLTYFFHEPTWWMRLITVGVVSLLGEIYYPLAQTVVGLDGWLQLRIIKVALVVAVCNLALSPIAILVCRWTLAERKLSV
jgi:rod shape-determining protein MreD